MSLANRLKRYKFIHWIYNLIHYKKLLHNKDAYKKYHLSKPLIASISSKDFPDKESAAWLDKGYSGELAPARAEFHRLPPSIQQQVAAWSDTMRKMS